MVMFVSLILILVVLIITLVLLMWRRLAKNKSFRSKYRIVGFQKTFPFLTRKYPDLFMDGAKLKMKSKFLRFLHPNQHNLILIIITVLLTLFFPSSTDIKSSISPLAGKMVSYNRVLDRFNFENKGLCNLQVYMIPPRRGCIGQGNGQNQQDQRTEDITSDDTLTITVHAQRDNQYGDDTQREQIPYNLPPPFHDDQQPRRQERGRSSDEQNPYNLPPPFHDDQQPRRQERGRSSDEQIPYNLPPPFHDDQQPRRQERGRSSDEQNPYNLPPPLRDDQQPRCQGHGRSSDEQSPCNLPPPFHDDQQSRRQKRGRSSGHQNPYNLHPPLRDDQQPRYQGHGRSGDEQSPYNLPPPFHDDQQSRSQERSRSSGHQNSYNLPPPSRDNQPPRGQENYIRLDSLRSVTVTCPESPENDSPQPCIARPEHNTDLYGHLVVPRNQHFHDVQMEDENNVVEITENAQSVTVRIVYENSVAYFNVLRGSSVNDLFSSQRFIQEMYSQFGIQADELREMIEMSMKRCGVET